MRELTNKEREVLKHIRVGRNYSEIAQAMKTHSKAIKTIASNICKALGVDSKNELIAVDRVFDEQNPALDKLSKAERGVLEQLCKGLSNNRISQNLFISEKTVKFHISNINRKSGTESRYQLIANFTKSGDSSKDLELKRVVDPKPIHGNFAKQKEDCARNAPVVNTPRGIVTGPIAQEKVDDILTLPIGLMNVLWGELKKAAA